MVVIDAKFKNCSKVYIASTTLFRSYAFGTVHLHEDGIALNLIDFLVALPEWIYEIWFAR